MGLCGVSQVVKCSAPGCSVQEGIDNLKLKQFKRSGGSTIVLQFGFYIRNLQAMDSRGSVRSELDALLPPTRSVCVCVC